MSQYTPIYEKPYPNGWKDLPTKETPVMAENLDAYDNAIENIEDYLSKNPIESGGDSNVDLTNLVVENSISIGRDPDAPIGERSLAVGIDANAAGDLSCARGYHTVAAGYASCAEGDRTESNGEASHAEGFYTKASSSYQHVQGKYNIEDTQITYAHIVGGGSSDTDRKNIHTLDWQGNAEYAGTVKSSGLILADTETGTKYKLQVTNGALSIIEAGEV